TLLETMIKQQVSVITADGRVIIGILRGFDNAINLILEDSVERVFSANSPVEAVPLGLYVIRGDNVSLVGELDPEVERRMDLSRLQADPLRPVVT
ncbi:hypothetical protein BOX15_Mlig021220g2, partial [Macrostomum lignano]